MAELEFMGELARKNKDVDLGARVNELLRLEQRYKCREATETLHSNENPGRYS